MKDLAVVEAVLSTKYNRRHATSKISISFSGMDMEWWMWAIDGLKKKDMVEFPRPPKPRLQCYRIITPVAGIGMKGRVLELEKGGKPALELIEPIDDSLEF